MGRNIINLLFTNKAANPDPPQVFVGRYRRLETLFVLHGLY